MVPLGESDESNCSFLLPPGDDIEVNGRRLDPDAVDMDLAGSSLDRHRGDLECYMRCREVDGVTMDVAAGFGSRICRAVVSFWCLGGDLSTSEVGQPAPLVGRKNYPHGTDFPVLKSQGDDPAPDFSGRISLATGGLWKRDA